LQRTLTPGIYFYLPVVEVPSPTISLKEQISEIEHQRVITRDNVEIDIDGNFFYKVVDPQKAYYNAEDFESAIQGLSTSVSRSEIGKMTLDEIFQNRKELNERIREVINDASGSWGLECLAFEVLKIEPPTEIKNALREVAIAERLRRKEIKISEAEKEFNEIVNKSKMEAEFIVQNAIQEGEYIVNKNNSEGLTKLTTELQRSENGSTIFDYILSEQNLKHYAETLSKNEVYAFPSEMKGGETGLLLATLLSQKKDVLLNTVKESNTLVKETIAPKQETPLEQNTDEETDSYENRLNRIQAKSIIME